MEQLPYFLLMLKQNALLYSIIVTGSFAQLDLSRVEHVIHSNHAVDFITFKLGDECFPKVTILAIGDEIKLLFFTTDSAYFDHPERYFQRNGVERASHPYALQGVQVQTRKKRLGNFDFQEPALPPASVVVRHSSVYGYVVSINFYKHNLPSPTH